MVITNLDKVLPRLRDRLEAFSLELVNLKPDLISINLVGSAVTADFDEKKSDINILIVLNEEDIAFVKRVSRLGKKYGSKGFAPPLILSKNFILKSLDTFAIEFFDFKLMHVVLFGEDFLSLLQIDNKYLRLQCERELKVRHISLVEGYIKHMGARDEVKNLLIKAITGTIPLFRSILYLMGKEPPILKSDAASMMDAICLQNNIFTKLLALKQGKLKTSSSDIENMYDEFISALEVISKLTDEMPQ